MTLLLVLASSGAHADTFGSKEIELFSQNVSKLKTIRQLMALEREEALEAKENCTPSAAKWARNFIYRDLRHSVGIAGSLVLESVPVGGAGITLLQVMTLQLDLLEERARYVSGTRELGSSWMVAGGGLGGIGAAAGSAIPLLAVGVSSLLVKIAAANKSEDVRKDSHSDLFWLIRSAYSNSAIHAKHWGQEIRQEDEACLLPTYKLQIVRSEMALRLAIAQKRQADALK